MTQEPGNDELGFSSRSVTCKGHSLNRAPRVCFSFQNDPLVAITIPILQKQQQQQLRSRESEAPRRLCNWKVADVGFEPGLGTRSFRPFSRQPWELGATIRDQGSERFGNFPKAAQPGRAWRAGGGPEWVPSSVGPIPEFGGGVSLVSS